MKAAFCPLFVVLAIASAGVHAQAWSPQRNVEIVVGSAPGGSNDKTGFRSDRGITRS